MPLDKDDTKHLEDYTRLRKELYVRIESLDTLIMKLEYKKGTGKEPQPTPDFYKGRTNKISTDAEVMNED